MPRVMPRAKPHRQTTPRAIAIAQIDGMRQQALQAALEASGANMAAWAREVAETARLAVSVGEFGPAIKAYELLGKHLGHLTEGAPQQHLHLHGAEGAALAALPDAVLRERLATLAAPVAVAEADPFA